MEFRNSWGNIVRSNSYAKLEFPNTYYLAYRDLPFIIDKHIVGNYAVDFGCGTGRSTRFLKQLGFNVIGIDISQDMLNYARELDPTGEYCLITNGKYDHLGVNRFDLIQSIFTFDNIPGWDSRVKILESLANLLVPSGKLILLDSNSEIYIHEWASFTTKDFPDNFKAKTGDVVKIVMTDVEDRSPVEDIFWKEEDYHKMFTMAGLELEETYKPKGMNIEPYSWVNEMNIAPWIIFVLRKK